MIQCANQILPQRTHQHRVGIDEPTIGDNHVELSPDVGQGRQAGGRARCCGGRQGALTPVASCTPIEQCLMVRQ
jgi:hypothetical protein